MDRQELGQRIVDWTPLLYHVACGLLSDESDREDAVQSAIEKAWRKADSLREPNKLKPWLVRILVNECHEVLRRRKREIPTENLPEESAPPPQEQRELRELVMALPEAERLPRFVAIMALEGFFYTRKFGVNPPFAELNAQAYGFINEKLVGEGAVRRTKDVA